VNDVIQQDNNSVRGAKSTSQIDNVSAIHPNPRFSNNNILNDTSLMSFTAHHNHLQPPQSQSMNHSKVFPKINPNNITQIENNANAPGTGVNNSMR
jgi:hypothetical protein